MSIHQVVNDAWSLPWGCAGPRRLPLFSHGQGWWVLTASFPEGVKKPGLPVPPCHPPAWGDGLWSLPGPPVLGIPHLSEGNAAEKCHSMVLVGQGHPRVQGVNGPLEMTSGQACPRAASLPRPALISWLREGENSTREISPVSGACKYWGLLVRALLEGCSSLR